MFLYPRMTNRDKSISNNFVILLIGQLISKPIWYFFFNFIIVYKLSQIENNFFAVAYFQTLLYLDFSDLGTGTFVNKYLAQKGDSRKHIISSIFSIRIILAAGLLSIYGIGLFLFSSSNNTRTLLLIGISYHIIIRNIEFCRSIFKGLNLMIFDSYSQLIEKAMVILIGTTLLFAYSSASATLLGMSIGALITLSTLITLIHFKISPVRLSYKPNAISFIIKNSLPLALLSTAIAFNKYMGINLLNHFHDEGSVGKLSFPLRYLEMLSIIPMLLVSSYFPYLVRSAYTKKIAEFKKGLINSVMILLTVGILFSLGLLVLIPYIYKIFPTQTNSKDVFIFLAFTLPIAFINNMLTTIILGINKEMKLFYITTFCFTTSFILNILLIPKYDIWGVVISWTIADILSLIAIITILVEYIRENSKLLVAPAD